MGAKGTKFKDPNMSTSNFSHLIFDKKTKNTYWKKKKKKEILSSNSSEEIGWPQQKNEIRPIFITLHENSKCIKDQIWNPKLWNY